MPVRTVDPRAFAALTVLLLAACATAEAPEAPEGATSPVEGAWSIVSIRVAGPDGETSPAVQPSLYLFVDNHYSIMRVTGEGPRALAAEPWQKLRAHLYRALNARPREASDTIGGILSIESVRVHGDSLTARFTVGVTWHCRDGGGGGGYTGYEVRAWRYGSHWQAPHSEAVLHGDSMPCRQGAGSREQGTGSGGG